MNDMNNMRYLIIGKNHGQVFFNLTLKQHIQNPSTHISKPFIKNSGEVYLTNMSYYYLSRCRKFSAAPPLHKYLIFEGISVPISSPCFSSKNRPCKHFQTTSISLYPPILSPQLTPQNLRN